MIFEVCAVLSTTFLCCNTCLACTQIAHIAAIFERMEGVNKKLDTLNEHAHNNTQLILQARREQRAARSCVAGVRIAWPRETETEPET